MKDPWLRVLGKDRKARHGESMQDPKRDGAEGQAPADDGPGHQFPIKRRRDPAAHPGRRYLI